MRTIIITLLLLLTVACASNYRSTNQQVQIAQEVYFELLSTIPYDKNLRLTQSATVTYQDQSHDLIFQTEIANGQLIMVGLTPTGTRLFTIQMDNTTISAQGLSAMVDKIKPEYLLADLQISLWPLQQIRSNLNNAVISQSSPLERLISKNNETLIRVQYTQAHDRYQGAIKFQHYQRQYRLTIEPLKIEVLSQLDQKAKSNDNK